MVLPEGSEDVEMEEDDPDIADTMENLEVVDPWDEVPDMTPEEALRQLRESAAR
jgi:hypothetical protein